MAEPCTESPRWEVVIEGPGLDLIVERTAFEVVIESGPRGPGLPPGVSVHRVGEYLQWNFPGGVQKHQRLLDGPAPAP